MALKSNTELQQFSVAFDKYNEELEGYGETLIRYEEKLNNYQLQNDADKELISNVGKLVDKNMNLDIAIRNEMHNELGNFKSKMQDYMEDEFTKIAARNIKSKRKIDAIFGFMIVSNIITIAGLVALYILK